MLEGILNVAMSAAQSEEFLQYASGGSLLPGSVPLAHRYGGHQVEFARLLLCNLPSKVYKPEYLALKQIISGQTFCCGLLFALH